jgi:hypothetical protein
MLEGNIENIEMPPKPSFYPNEIIEDIESETDSDSDSVSFIVEDTSKPLLMNSV